MLRLHAPWRSVARPINMLTALYVLALEQILQGLYNLWEGIRWLAMARARMSSHPGFYTPRVALFCPVKGIDSNLEQNLTGLTEFDYPQYEIFFSLASAEDPALKILEKLRAANKHPVHIVLAGRPQNSTEKVSNLIAAVRQAGEGFDVFVFTDSDGRPGRSWLARMVAPLSNSNLGATTTFRWLFPQRGGFWSALASAWNAPAASYLGEHSNNFCWGGGTAIRRAQFEQAGVLQFWNGSASDDLSLTLALRQAGLPIYFAPECLVPSLFDCNAAGFWEFTNRQIILARVYLPRIWAIGGAAHLLYCATVLLGLGMFIANTVSGAPAVDILLLAFAPPVLCMARGAQRMTAVMELLPAWKQKMLADGWMWTLLAPFAPFAALWNSIVALSSRKIRWRGLRYLVVAPGQTRIVMR